MRPPRSNRITGSRIDQHPKLLSDDLQRKTLQPPAPSVPCSIRSNSF